MDKTEFFAKLNEAPRPVVVDFWAPWCGPCRAMEPMLQQAGQKYAGQVDVWKVNADESPEVLKALRVMGIPTVIGFAQGKEILRRTGVESTQIVEMVFDSALNQHRPDVIPPAPMTRLLRTGMGVGLVALGWLSWHSWIVVALGIVVVFTAFYDRCPVFRAVAPRVRAFFRRRPPDEV
jgi:thioredoxin 1